MTYGEIKQKQKKISQLNTKIAVLRANAEGTTQQLSQAPSSSGAKDKVGDSATLITHYESTIDNIKSEIDAAIDALPNTIEGNCIRLRCKKKYSWTKLAYIAGGNNTADSIKKRCYRYDW